MGGRGGVAAAVGGPEDEQPSGALPPGRRAAAAGPEQVGLGCTVGNFCLWMRRKWELYMDG